MLQGFFNDECQHRFYLAWHNGVHIYCPDCTWCWRCSRYVEIGV